MKAKIIMWKRSCTDEPALAHARRPGEAIKRMKGIFPPRDVCPNCGDEAKELYTFSGKGEVYSFRTIYEAPSGYDSTAPYTVALVKLDEGPMVTAQLTDIDNDAVEIGMPVEMVTRKMRNDGDERGLIVYGYKFRPAWNIPTK
jgi:uncharacterized OB-fold protein